MSPQSLVYGVCLLRERDRQTPKYRLRDTILDAIRRRDTITLCSPMSPSDYDFLPEAVRRFLPWEEACQGEIITSSRRIVTDEEGERLAHYFLEAVGR